MVRHWPPKLFVLMTLAFHFSDTASNLQKMYEEKCTEEYAKTVFIGETHTVRVRACMDLLLTLILKVQCLVAGLSLYIQ